MTQADPADALLQKACAGDEAAFAQLFDNHRGRLKRMVSLRIDERLRQRVDESDVIQEAFIDASKRLGEYAADPKIEFFLWIRLVTGQALGQMHRRHLGAQKRDAGREVSADRPWAPQASTMCLAARLVGQFTSVGARAGQREMQDKLRALLDGLEENDREVLALKHFEELTNAEIGQVIGVTESAASKRYIRALRRLQQSAKAAGLIDPNE